MTVLMKRGRGREDDTPVEAFAMANCLMLLSRINNNNNNNNNRQPQPFSGRVFRCKTCDREFQSFRALGGHRASHKKPRLLAGDLFPSTTKPKTTHDCSICGLEFTLGQALGGHMRRHRGSAGEKSVQQPVIKKPNTSTSTDERVFGLDLNLTPSENDFMLGNQQFCN